MDQGKGRRASGGDYLAQYSLFSFLNSSGLRQAVSKEPIIKIHYSLLSGSDPAFTQSITCVLMCDWQTLKFQGFSRNAWCAKLDYLLVCKMPARRHLTWPCFLLSLLVFYLEYALDCPGIPRPAISVGRRENF